jgi:hypothetical protein
VLCRRDTAQQQALQGSRVALHRSSAAYHNPLPNQSARGFSLLQQARQPSTKIALVDGPRTWAVLGCEPIHESTLPQVAVVSLQILSYLSASSVLFLLQLLGFNRTRPLLFFWDTGCLPNFTFFIWTMPGLLRMGGRSFPPHIKVTAHQPTQRFFEETVVVNHYTNTDKLIPAIPGFKTSAGEYKTSFPLVSWGLQAQNNMFSTPTFPPKLFKPIQPAILTQFQPSSPRSAQTSA